MNRLGERVYTLRTMHKLSQGDLAEKLNVSRQTVSKWENNISVPDLDKIVSMSNVFGVTIDYIVKGEKSDSIDAVTENNGENEGEAECVKTLTVSPTKNIIASLSISLGAVYLVTVLTNCVSLISNFINGLSGSYIIPMLCSMLISFVTCVCLLAVKLKGIGIAYALLAVYSLINMAAVQGGLNAVAIMKITGYLFVVLLCFKGSKKNRKLMLAVSASAFILAFAVETSKIAGHFVTADMPIMNIISSVVSTAVSSVPYIVVNLGVGFIMYLKADPKPDYDVPENEYRLRVDMYKNLIAHVLLTLFTLGVYNCVWIYKTTESLNCGTNEKQSGAKKLLLCIFVPFYRIYWYYNQSKRLEKLMKTKDCSTTEFAAITLILAIFVPVVAASTFLQIKLNEYVKQQV